MTEFNTREGRHNEVKRATDDRLQVEPDVRQARDDDDIYALFCVPEGWMAGTEGFSGQNRTLCQVEPPPENYPRGWLEG